MTQRDILIVGDLNLHCELDFALGVKLLNEPLAEHNLQQHVTESTHIRGHRLNLVITRSLSSIVSSTTAYPSSISDHYSVAFLLSSANPMPACNMRHMRDIRGINHDRFEADLSEHLASVDINMDVSAVVDKYEHAIISTVDVHAPVMTRTQGTLV